MMNGKRCIVGKVFRSLPVFGITAVAFVVVDRMESSVVGLPDVERASRCVPEVKQSESHFV